MPAPRPVRGTLKTPRQERSRLMVERIVAAGREVLLDVGHEAASTNRIARAAGISPGSLYQYFPDKEAIVGAVVDQYSDELSARITASLTDHLHEQGLPLVRSTLEALLDALEDNAAFLRVVVEDLPQAENRARLDALETRVVELVAAYLSARREDLRDLHPPTAAWVLVRAIEQLTVRHVLERPDITRAELVSEVTRLVTGYLGTDLDRPPAG